MPVQPVILAGGVGSRLAPLSTQTKPKQFLELLSNEPMIKLAIERAEQFGGVATVIGQQIHCVLLQQHCPDKQVILQPGDRGTAAGLTLAALLSDSEDVMLVLPADHVIDGERALRSAFESAIEGAEQGDFVCFGVDPTAADSSFGYLAAKSPKALRSPLRGFVEKPSVIQAQELIDQGWVWNSGMFVVQAGVFLEQARRYEPELVRSMEDSLSSGSCSDLKVRPDSDEFLGAPWVSVDRGILERATVSSVVRLDAGWNDVGTWSRLWEASGLHDGELLALPKIEPEWIGVMAVTNDLVLTSGADAVHLSRT